MTDIGNIRSFITADSTDFDRNLDKAGAKSDSFARKATRNFKKVGDEMRSLGRSMSLAVTLPLAVAGAGLLKLASDAEETQNKFDVVFSSISDDANAASVSLASSFGLASDQSQKLLADTGDLLTGFGFSQKAALDLATEVNILAADLASFTNIEGGAERASRALTKALLGERESVKELGISILDADVKARVLENTQKGLTFETGRQAKAFATLQLAQEQSKNAIGDFARSSDSFANQMRIATAETRDMAVAFGQQLLPVGMLALQWAKDIFAAFSSLSPETQRLAIVIGIVASAIGPLLFIGGTLISMFIGMLAAVAPVVIVIGAVGAALVALPGAVSFVVDAFRSLSNFFGEFGAFLSGEWADLSADSQTAIEIIAKGWLSLKIAWSVVGNALVGTVRVIAQAISNFVGGIEWLASKFGIDLPEGVKNFSKSMDIAILSLKDVEAQNAKTLAGLTSQWDAAPELLREDVNALVDTFKALPEGIVAQLESAFPGAVEAVRNLVAQVQEFISSGELPPIIIPVVPSLAGGGEDGGGADSLGISDMAAVGEEIEKFQKKQREATKAIRGMWMGVGSTYANVFGQMSSLMSKNSTEQKAFAISSIILDTAIGIMKAMELPFPLNWAQAAAVGALGIAQLAVVGGGGGSANVVEESGTNFSDQTALSGGVGNSQVIGSPEDSFEPAPVVLEGVLMGDDLAFVLTRAFGRGVGDGVNTVVLQGA